MSNSYLVKREAYLGIMKNFIEKQSVFLLAVVMTMSSLAAAEVNVSAQVNTQEEIYAGDIFNYHIIIEGDNRPGDVDISPLAQYEPRRAGNKDYSQTSVRIINGKTTRTVKKQFVMSYSLTALGAGQIQLPSVSVTVDGRDYKTEPITVNVVRPGTTDNLELQVSLSKRRCFAGEPILLTVKFYISVEIGDFQFNIPALNRDDFYVEDSDKPNPQSKQYQLRNGVAVNLSQYRLTYKDRESILLSFSKIIIPKNPGRCEFGPSSVLTDVVVGQGQRSFFGRDRKYKRFMVSSEPLVLEVEPLPLEAEPGDFYGLVGNYKIWATAEPRKVNMGDPITLTISIGGSDYLKAVAWPRLEAIPEMVENFKIPSERSSPTIEDGVKIFTQTIRPIKNDVKVIPSIPLAVFDVDKGRYVIEKTEPIELEVVPTKLLTASDMQGKNFVPISREVEAIRSGLSANVDGPDALRNQKFSVIGAITAPGYLAIWALPLAVLITSALTKIMTHTTPEKQAAKRKRGACRKAVAIIRKTHSAQAIKKNELLVSAMREYAGDRFDRNAGALTADDCYELILAATKDERSAQKYREIIGDCQVIQYASTKTEIGAEQIKETVGLIRKIEKKCR